MCAFIMRHHVLSRINLIYCRQIVRNKGRGSETSEFRTIRNSKQKHLYLLSVGKLKKVSNQCVGFINVLKMPSLRWLPSRYRHCCSVQLYGTLFHQSECDKHFPSLSNKVDYCH